MKIDELIKFVYSFCLSSTAFFATFYKVVSCFDCVWLSFGLNDAKDFVSNICSSDLGTALTDKGLGFETVVDLDDCCVCLDLAIEINDFLHSDNCS